MSAADILARRNAEVAQRKEDKKQSVAALFEAYPDIKAFLGDLKDAGFPVTLSGLTWTIHGPSRDDSISYAATVDFLKTPPVLQTRAKGASGARTSTGKR